jgi:hypothetical protein
MSQISFSGQHINKNFFNQNKDDDGDIDMSRVSLQPYAGHLDDAGMRDSIRKYVKTKNDVKRIVSKVDEYKQDLRKYERKISKLVKTINEAKIQYESTRNIAQTYCVQIAQYVWNIISQELDLLEVTKEERDETRTDRVIPRTKEILQQNYTFKPNDQNKIDRIITQVFILYNIETGAIDKNEGLLKTYK